VRKIKSPLRYPGGKSRAVDIILSYIPRDTKKLCSPFLGGGSVELACAAQGMEVKAYDVFEPLVCFWNALLKDNKALHTEVMKYHPITKDVFKTLQKTNPTMTDDFEKGATFYVLNRSSFSGSTMSGGMSAGQRFNVSNIDYLKDFKVDNFTVELMDFRDSIAQNPDAFLYLDPPYLLDEDKNNLYGNRGDTHRGFDHAALFDLVKDRDNWVMSYNNGKEILDMYAEFPQVEPQWAYGMSKDKSAKEVLIFSKNLASSVATNGLI
jgi:DNA adenine methylase